VTDDDLGHADIEAALEARRELGARYDAELVAGFADRVERAVSERVSAELSQRSRANQVAASGGPRQLALAIISLAACIPISIVLALNGALFALVVTLGAIVAVNAAHAWQSR